MEYCFFDKNNPPKYDIDFYKTGIYSISYAHIDNGVHNLRMEAAAGLLRHWLKYNKVNKIIDLGCGDGGFLQYVTKDDQDREYIGYELCKANYDVAIKRLRDKENVEVNYIDFTTIKLQADLAIMTEVLEHLVSPHEFLKNLNVKYVLASSPFNETPDKRIGLGTGMVHLWGWDEEGFERLFNDWHINIYGICRGTIQGHHQFIIAERKKVK